MNAFLKNYDFLMKCLLCVIVVHFLFWYFVLKPKAERLDDALFEVADIQKALGDSASSLGPSKLNAINSELNAVVTRSKLDANYKEGIDHACETFQKQIANGYKSVSAFRNNASRLDLQTEFDRMAGHLADRGMTLEEPFQKMSGIGASGFFYQNIMYVWTAEKLMNLALDSNLIVCKKTYYTVNKTEHKSRRTMSAETNAREDVPGVVCTSVAALPVRSYFMESDSTVPYCIEFPVSIEVQGRLDNSIAFLSSLNSSGVFLPVSSFEFFSVPGRSFTNIPDNVIRMKLVCSSFLYLDR